MDHSNRLHSIYAWLSVTNDFVSLQLKELFSVTKNKNSSGDEIANVNFYAVRPEATRIRWSNAK